MPARNESNEIRITRLYDAPVKAVWDAWTDPAQVTQWWGPRGFTITTHSTDLRPGGAWRFTMHGPDGVDYPNVTKYFEVEPMARLVYDHGATDDQPPLFRVTVTFREEKSRDGVKTRMEMSMTLATPEAAAETRKFVKKAGGNATWDRLAEHLDERGGGMPRFYINRVFDAPIATMHRMWTDPAHFSKWLAPTGFSMKFMRADIRPGGSTFYLMTDGGKVTMYGRAEYLELTPTRLVYTQSFCDEHEKLSRHPMAPTWPATMRTVVTFAEEGPDCTRVTVQWEPCGDVTAEEIATFVAGRAGMTGGWTGSFDKLEAILGG